MVSKREKQIEAEKQLKILHNIRKKEKENFKENKIPSLIEDFKHFNILKCKINPIEGFTSKLKSKDRQKNRYELVKYLFVKYSVPKILEQVWFNEISPTQYYKCNIKNNNYKLTESRYHSWYTCAATGGSLHKEYLKNFLTKKETLFFIKCNKKITIEKALYYSIALAAGATEGIAYRIACSKISDFSYENDFWRDCARFFAKNPPKNIENLNDLLDFINAKYTENKNYKLFGQGLNIDSLNQRMIDWHYELRRNKILSGFSWEGDSNNDVSVECPDSQGKKAIWSLIQIKTGKKLSEEGNKMHHCVSSYADKCKEGLCSIWSLSMQGIDIENFNTNKKVATIEVRNNKIVQKRGFANRKLRNFEEKALFQTTLKNGLIF